jgi:hypothetical protein
VSADPVYADAVKRGMAAINPAVVEVAGTFGWPAALDALSTVLLSLLIAAVGPDEARATCGRMFAEVARLDREWAPLFGNVASAVEGRA